MQTFNATQLQSKLATVFNSVQSDGEVLISGRSRPTMVLMLESEKETLIEKIKQLTDLVKSKSGDSHLQKDLLK